jgi:hypothetical protein
MKRYPPTISCFANKTSPEVQKRLELTCDHFNVTTHRPFLYEVLLRLGDSMRRSSIVHLPVDDQGKALFQIYKYFDSLNFSNN